MTRKRILHSEPPARDGAPSRRDVLAFLTVLLAGSTFDLRALSESKASEQVAKALFEAIVRGDRNTVTQLLTQHPTLSEATDGQGRSGYAVAQLEELEAIAQLFIEHGYERDLVETCLARDWKALEGFPFSPPAVEDRHAVGDCAMTVAARRGIGNDVWRLYSLGGKPDRCIGTPPTVAAFEDPDLARAELTAAGLLSNGANPNAASENGTTALHSAAERGSAEIVELLIRLGADTNAENSAGQTALDLLSVSDSDRDLTSRQACLDLLKDPAAIAREHSTSRRAYDASGNPYRPPGVQDVDEELRSRAVGVSHGNLEAIASLVKQEPRLAHSVAATTEGAVEASAHMGNLEIVDLLLERGAPCSLPTAVVRGDISRVKALLDEDPLRIHERGAHSFALLWYPIIGDGSLEMARLLLDRGCEVEDQHFLGTTALHWAAMSGDAAMVSLLLEHGGNPTRPGRKFGGRPETPIDLAKKRDHQEIVELLSKA